MEKEVITVVDSAIFKEELDLAKVAIPFAESLLTNKVNVAKLFRVHTNTITNWIENGTLKEGVHYIKEDGKIIFIPIELLKYKLNPIRQPKKEPYQKNKEIENLV